MYTVPYEIIYNLSPYSHLSLSAVQINNVLYIGMWLYSQALKPGWMTQFIQDQDLDLTCFYKAKNLLDIATSSGKGQAESLETIASISREESIESGSL